VDRWKYYEVPTKKYWEVPVWCYTQLISNSVNTVSDPDYEVHMSTSSPISLLPRPTRQPPLPSSSFLRSAIPLPPSMRSALAMPLHARHTLPAASASAASMAYWGQWRRRAGWGGARANGGSSRVTMFLDATELD
jgi:hypothetical protein